MDEPKNNTTGNIVDAAFGCQACGERDADRLEIDADDKVRCATCGKRYQIEEDN